MAPRSFVELIAMGRVPAPSLRETVRGHASAGMTLPVVKAIEAIGLCDLDEADVLDLMKATLRGSAAIEASRATILSYVEVNAHLLTVAAGLAPNRPPRTPSVDELTRRAEVTAPELKASLREHALASRPIAAAAVKDLIDRMELEPGDIRELAAIADRGYARLSAQRDRRAADEYGRIGVHLAMRGYGMERTGPGMGR